MKLKLFLLCFWAFPLTLLAQPYHDLVTSRYTFSPAAAGLINQDEPDLEMQHFVFGANLPLPLNKNKSSILLSLPYYEVWKIATYNQDVKLQGIAIPIGFRQEIGKTFSLTGIVTYRNNKQTNGFKKVSDADQWGAIILAGKKFSNTLTLRGGIYYNDEFSGTFITPLVGLDWQINQSNNLFGTLPGAITWESRINSKSYYGINFRAITNSYLRSLVDPCFEGDCNQEPFYRVDENQVGFYLDYYLLKNIVLNAEVGHSVLRKFRIGSKGKDIDWKEILSKQDNLYFRVTAAYRLRFR